MGPEQKEFYIESGILMCQTLFYQLKNKKNGKVKNKKQIQIHRQSGLRLNLKDTAL